MFGLWPAWKQKEKIHKKYKNKNKNAEPPRKWRKINVVVLGSEICWFRFCLFRALCCSIFICIELNISWSRWRADRLERRLHSMGNETNRCILYVPSWWRSSISLWVEISHINRRGDLHIFGYEKPLQVISWNFKFEVIRV